MKKYIYEYDSIFPKKVVVAEGECLVCKHCTDMFYDYTNGPYMVMCEYTFVNEDGDDEDLSDLKEYGKACDKYEYDGKDREVIEDDSNTINTST